MQLVVTYNLSSKQLPLRRINKLINVYMPLNNVDFKVTATQTIYHAIYLLYPLSSKSIKIKGC
jgi:hypothetical protein